MKIGILTFHFAHNSGAVLQAYALQHSLIKLGYDASIVNYIPDSMEKNKYKKYKILPNNKGLSIKTKIRIISRLIFNFFVIANRIDSYENFIKNNLNISKRVKKEELKTLDFDVFILGSDQIWNKRITYGVEDAYFGAFVDKNRAKIISYAASLGENKIEDKEQFKQLLNKLDVISLREKDSVDFVKKYTNKDVIDVLDPTLLISKEEWENKFDLEFNEKKYVVFCIINQEQKDLAFAKKIAKENSLKLIILRDYKDIRNFNLKTLINTPITFLSLIKNSEYVITDSFHGVVFSIIFGKEFFVIRQDSKFLRIESLLDKLQIKGRIIGEEIQEIDYDNVYKILEKERARSIKFLKDSLVGENK